jgi:hypothetical protein
MTLKHAGGAHTSWVLQVGEEVLCLSGSVCVWMCRVLCISLV